MIFLMIAASFTGSVLFTLMLRKMDRNSLRLAQIKRMGEIQNQQLENATREHLRAIQDASIEFSTMIRQSRQLRDQMEHDFQDLTEKFNLLNDDREIIESIAGEVAGISASARNVNDQAERIDLGLKKMAQAESEMIRIRTGLENLLSGIDLIHREADARIHAAADDLSRVSEERMIGIIENIESQMDSVKNQIGQFEEKITALDTGIDETYDSMHIKMNQYFENLDREIHNFSEEEKNKLQITLQAVDEDLLRLKTRNEESRNQSDEMQNRINELNEIVEHKWQEESRSIENRWTDLALNLESDMIRKMDELKDIWNNSSSSLGEKISSDMLRMEEKWKIETIDLTEKLQSEISQIKSKWMQETSQFEENHDEQISRLEEKLNLKSSQLEENLDRQISGLDGKLNLESSRIEEKWILETGRLEEKFGNIENKLLERFHSLDKGLTAIRTTAVESLQNDVTRIRSDLDNFNLEAISKRDEILNETRRMAERMGDQINLFQEKYLEAENRLIKFADQEKNAIRSRIESFEEEWNEMEDRRLASVEDKIKNMESMIDEIRDRELKNLGREAEVFRENFKTFVKENQDRLDSHALDLENTLKTVIQEEEFNLIKTKEKYNELSSSLGDLAGDLKQSLKNEASESMTSIKKAGDTQTEAVLKAREELDKIHDELMERAEEISNSVIEIEKVRKIADEKSLNALEQIEARKDEALDELENRAVKFLSIQDERLSELSKTIDEKISHHLTLLVNNGQFKVDELENRISSSIQKAASSMEEDLERAKNDFRQIRDEVRAEMDKNALLKEEIFEELSKDVSRMKKFEDRLSLIDRAYDLAEKLDETVEILTDRLEMAREENSQIDSYMRNLEAVRLSRKELEKELGLVEIQKAKLADTEKYISGINHKVEELHDRLDIIAAGDQMADRMEERMIHLSEYKDSFEKFFFEMSEKKKYIENAIRFIEKSKQQVKESRDSSEKLLQKVERAEIRQIDMEKYLQTLEGKTNLLNNMEDEIQKVEARFDQMEGLMKDMENRQKQIGSMNRRMEEIRTEGEEMKIEIESLLTEADEKMERLSAFYQLIEKTVDEKDNSPPGAEDEMTVRPGRTKTASGVADWKREGILSLYLNHKWEPDLIADKMKIDPAVVRAVISSHV